MKVKLNLNREQNTSYWDAFAEERLSQQIGGLDDSFDNVLVPAILNEIPCNSDMAILDAGCGAGIFTNKLSENARLVDGIDGSGKSIYVANQMYGSKNKIRFFHSYIEDYGAKDQSYDIIVANMVLMDLVDLSKAVSNISRLLKNNGAFIFTITHPCFWPKYWEYEDKEWFDYMKEIPIEHDFKIANKQTSFKTVHIHRPLQKYVSVLDENGFVAKKMIELKGAKFSYPRFLLFKCEKSA